MNENSTQLHVTMRNGRLLEAKRPVGLLLLALVYVVLGLWLSWPEARSRFIEIDALKRESLLKEHLLEKNKTKTDRIEEEADFKRFFAVFQSELSKPLRAFLLEIAPFLISSVGVLFIISAVGLSKRKRWSLYSLMISSVTYFIGQIIFYGVVIGAMWRAMIGESDGIERITLYAWIVSEAVFGDLSFVILILSIITIPYLASQEIRIQFRGEK